MFKKIQKIIPYVLLILVVLVFSTHEAHASWWDQFTFLGMMDSMVAAISQLVLYVMHYWVVVTAALFSVSINLNLHIKEFVDATTGVYTVWKTIRDICSIFVIFMLLYTAIKLILSQEEKGLDSVGHLIKSIVIAGILINFSFFITSLLIDASNMVSLAIYKGIVSTDQTLTTSVGSSPCLTGNSATPETTCLVNSILTPGTTGSDASLADFFMSKLSPQSAYNLTLNDSSTAKVPSTDPAPLKTLIQGVVGAVIMFTIGMSFLFASIAFASRMVILVILLAFSSIWFASMIFPSLKEKSKEFTDILKGQLIFMPVYLILLYGALVVLNNSTVFSVPNSSVTTSGNWISDYIVLFVNDFFIIFLLNLPLVTAFSFAQSTTKWMGADKFNANAIWSKVGKSTGSFVGRNTAGRAAHIAANSGAMRNLSAYSPLVGNIVSKQLDKTANYGFGTKKGGFKDVAEQKQKDYEKQYENVGKASAAERAKYDNTDLSRNKVTGKTQLDRYLEARQDEHYTNMSKPTIMSSLVNKATETAQYATNALAPGAISPETYRNVGSNLSASFSTGESAAVQVIKKKREADKLKADKKLAEADEERVTNAHSTERTSHKEELGEFNKDIEKLDEDMQVLTEKETELTKVVASELPMKNLHNPNSTTANEISLADTKTRLDEIKAKKVELEKQKAEAVGKFAEKVETYNDEIAKINKRKAAGTAAEKEEEGADLKSYIDKKFKESGDSKGGGGSFSPKKDEPSK